MRILCFVVCIAAAAAVATCMGCGQDTKDKLVGKWQGEPTAPKAGGKLDEEAVQMLRYTTLELLEDEKFVMVMGPKARIEGDWTLEENRLTLTYKTLNGRPAKEAQGADMTDMTPEFTLSENRSRLIVVSDRADLPGWGFRKLP